MEIKNRKETYLYWTLLMLIAIFFTISGFLEVTKNASTYPKTLSMGYPPYFILALGIAKFGGAIALLQTTSIRLKEWAFAGFTFDVIFAFISGRAINSPADCAKSAVVFCLLMLTYFLYYRRYLTQINLSRRIKVAGQVGGCTAPPSNNITLNLSYLTVFLSYLE